MKTLTLSEKALCFRQLANFLQAAIPLSQALALLQTDHSRSRLTPLLKSVAHDLAEGRSLSQSAKAHPRLFTPFAIELIQLGEATGQLDTCLLTLATSTEAECAAFKQLKQTLTYPTIIFATSTLLLLSLFYWIIPRFMELYQTRIDTLPALTRVLFWCALHMNTGLTVFGLALLVLLGIHHWYRPTHPLIASIPLLRHYWRQANVLRFTEGLGLALGAGLPIDTSLRLAGSESRDPTLSAAIQDIRQQLHRGSPLYQAIKQHACFPALLTAFIQTGEATGQVDTLLKQAHHQLNEMFKHELQQTLSFLEPLIMLGQGALIGGIVIGLYLPIFNLGTLL